MGEPDDWEFWGAASILVLMVATLAYICAVALGWA